MDGYEKWLIRYVMKKEISKSLSNKILYLGVSMKTKGGMTAVLVSYKQYIEKMHFIPTWRLGNKITKAWYAFQALIRTSFLLIFNSNIKIVHIHGAANASFYRCRMYIKVAKLFNRKVILHEHAADFKEFYNATRDKKAITKTLNDCDCLIVLSKSWKAYFTSIGVNDRKIHILNNIVPFPCKKSQDYNKSINKKLHLLFLGEISYRKGGFDLLKAIDKHKDYLKDKLAVRIGGNEVDGDIKKYIKENELSDIVNFEGWILGQDKIECLNWADVYILPSYNEGLPIAILEAMSYKCPVISTPVGGIPEIVHPNINGVLVEPGNMQEIANAIKLFIENPDLISKYGEESFKIVQPYFPKNVFEQLSKIYNSLLKIE